ncbi:MAG TPA: transposase [Sphingomicrobium sp.]|nr:transposase [Sphingomicrobium sp.]
MTPAELIGLVRTLIGEVSRLRAESDRVTFALAKLRVEHQSAKDELARMKKLPPRPPQKPSGMDKATNRLDTQANPPKGGRSTQRRGSNLDKLTVTQTIELKVDAPAGSRHKGYDEIVVQDLVLNPLVTRYRRERWETPDGETVTAPLDLGIVGGYGPHLQRLILMLHFQGQMTCDRILTLLNGAGVVISKRQIVRLLTVNLETFRAEDAEVLAAGLRGSPFVTVDDTGARHAGKACFTTHIGSDRFAAFRTGPGKSRLAFLGRLLDGAAHYAINAAAIAYMHGADLAQDIIDRLGGHASRVFGSHGEWMDHLRALGLTELRVTPDPVRIASEAGLWGAIEAEGLLAQTVIVSDDAGQFRVGVHALCWVHAERLIHKLVPANNRQRNAIEVAKRMVWWFYRQLKDYKLAPSPEWAALLSARFDRIFKRRTGYATLDHLLKRLLRRKDELLRVLERPEIPLNANASENDIRAFVTKRKISGGTVSEKGREARDAMLGLAKTCKKLKIPFFDYIGARIAIPGPDVPKLATLVRAAPS